MSTEVALPDHMAILNSIIEGFVLKGEMNPTKIAKALHMKRGDVVTYLEEWKNIAANDEDIKARASVLLTELDQSYSQIIKELWNSHATALTAKDEAAILKIIADVIAKRHEVLKTAGLYADNELGDHMAVLEEQAEKIKELLIHIANDYPQYPEIRTEIMAGIGHIFGKVVGVST